MKIKLTGTVEDLRKEIDQVVATAKIVGLKDFEQWFEQWKTGFPSFTANRKKGISNFILEGETPWRKPENYPRYREWTTPEQREQFGSRIIEYWPDRSNESFSIVLTGTDQELINQILQLEYEGGGSASYRGDKSLPPLQGFPEIVLHFQEDKPTISNFRIRAEKSFRMTEYTDNPNNIKLNKISEGDLRKFADKILQNFTQNGKGIIWQKGKKVVSYKGKIPREQGFDGWIYCKNKSDGIDIFNRMAAVAGVKIDKKFIRYSETEDESDYNHTKPEKIQVAGKQVTLPLKRPICDVRFYRADIVLPWSRQTLKLVLGGRNVAGL